MAADSKYMLPRGNEEIERLNFQHKFITALHDERLIHPNIPRQAIKNVADVGTGTGAWLFDVANQFATGSGEEPDVNFVGFDITAKQFPSKEIPNIKFVVHGVFQPFPQECQGKFDLVNVRLLTYALTTDSIQTAVENVAQLLRPGGYVQWEETDIVEAWKTIETPEARKAVRYILKERLERRLPPSVVTPLVKTIQAIQLPKESLSNGKIDPLNWTSDLLRIMALESASTSSHPAPLLRERKTDWILDAVVALLKTCVMRRERAIAGLGTGSPEAERQTLQREADEIKGLVELMKPGGAQRNLEWDIMTTRIVARKAILVDEDGSWMAARHANGGM